MRCDNGSSNAKTKPDCPGCFWLNSFARLLKSFCTLPSGEDPQQDELPALLERALRRVLDQVHALLLREARDDADDGRPGLREVHREPLRELRLRRLFSRFPRPRVEPLRE